MSYQAGKTAGVVAVSAAVIALLYVVHAFLQRQYYVHCTSNILRVVLLQRSDMCVQLSAVLRAIETVCSHNILGALGLATTYVASMRQRLLPKITGVS